jgi:hypothetical protein
MASSLYSTKYPDNIRIVSGTPTIYRDDVVLLCDTSTSAVTINLLEIPANKWNTIYKLYVVDYSNNAFINPITINAPAGFLINNASSLTINSNGGQYLIRISSNTTYIAQLNGCCSSGGVVSVHLVTNAQLLTAISNSTLVQGDFYIVTDVTNADTYVTLQASTTNAIATDGSGYFLNADYQNVGVYSSVSGFVAQTGLWNNTGTYVIGDVVIWDNYHWKNISGSNSGNPSTTPVDWEQIAKSKTTGYISEVDFVVYDPTLNLIKTRYDFRNNEIDYCDNGGGRVTLNDFPFGSDRVTYNKVKGYSLCYFCNSPSVFRTNTIIDAYLTDYTNISGGSTGSVNGNTLFNGSTIQLTSNQGFINDNNLNAESSMLIDTNGTAYNISGNNLTTSGYISVATNNGSINYNTLFGEGFISVNQNLGSINENVVGSQCNITIANTIGVSNYINSNVINSSSYISVGTLAGTSYITENNISASSYIKVDDAVTLTNSYIKQNTISANSYIRVLANSSGNNIWQNFLNSYSYLTTTGAHTGNIRGNNIQLSSYITIGSSAGGSDLSGNEVYDFSSITIGSSVTQIDGNILRYQSTLSVTTCNAGAYVTANQIIKNSSFTITTNGGNTLANLVSQNSTIVLGTTSNVFNYNQATQGGQFNIATLSGATTYCVAADGQNVTQNITATTTNKIAKQGYSNWEWTLNLSSGSVYSGTTVTIPTAQSYVGIFNLTNCGGKTIRSIANSPSKQRFRFTPADTNFVLSDYGVGVAVATNIVSNHYTNAGGGANTITYRANACDYVLFELEGTIVGVVEKNSWA